MAIRLEETRRFEATSPVARYWLTQCNGFRVRGAGRGTVVEIVADADPYTPQLLVVRGVYRRREIPISAVEAVVPAERLIVLGNEAADRDQRKRRHPVRAAGRLAARGAAPLLAVARRGPSLLRPPARASRRGAVALGGGVVALVRPLRAFGLAAVRGAAAAARSAAQGLHRCGRFARVVAASLAAMTRFWIAHGRAAVRGFSFAAASSVEALRANRRAAVAQYRAALPKWTAVLSRLRLPRGINWPGPR
jgi:hypothetical protein